MVEHPTTGSGNPEMLKGSRSAFPFLLWTL